MENQANVGDQNTQQIGQNPINQPPVNPVPEKPKLNYWMISTITLTVLFFGFVGWYFFISPQNNTTKTNTLTNSTDVVKNQTTDNDFNVTRVIVNPTKFEPPNKDQNILKYGYNESASGKYEADVGILLISSYKCPPEAISVREYEGSILGSFGINKAVTYLLPQLDTTSCTKDSSENQYKELVSKL